MRPVGAADPDGAPRRPGGCDSVASTIWAPIATATSSGERAPIASPIGAWIRAMPASPTPSARSRSSRSAVVTLLPIAPM